MTYDAKQSGIETGNPVELYLFNLQGTRYAYNNGEGTVSVSGIDYLEEEVSRSRQVVESERRNNKMTINLPGDNEFVQLYADLIPAEQPEFTLQQMHRDDGEVVTLFRGFVETVAWVKDALDAKITIGPLSAAGQRETPRHTYQGICNHMLYDSRCTITEGSREEIALSISVVSGRNVTLTGTLGNPNTPGTALDAGSDYFEAGYIEFGNERRLIVGQTANVMKLNIPFRSDVAGQTVRVLPGCKHRIGPDCNTKFGNAINFGGFPYVPEQNPFETGID